MTLFRQIAIPLIERGFRITPVSPETKSGVMHNWQNFQFTTSSDIDKYEKYFPEHNAGVVGKRGVGRHCFLDIDADGELARIESETGHVMPKTYTVCSRPQSAPFKRHFYFVQTDYSFKKFGAWQAKNLNVKDMTRVERSPRSGLMIHPTLYDVKGVGGGSLVVAAGSRRDSGEVYTCVDDSPVAPIPDWLTDWIIADVRRYQTLKYKERAVKFKAKAETLRLGAVERRRLRKVKSADGFDIAQEDAYDFLRWRASELSGLGVTGEALKTALFFQAKRFCEGGADWIETDRGKETIDKIAREKRHVGDATWFYRLGTSTSDGLRITDVSKRSLVRQAVSTFPDRVSSVDAVERIQIALEPEGFDLDQRRDKDTLLKIRKELGFEIVGGYWEKRGIPSTP